MFTDRANVANFEGCSTGHRARGVQKEGSWGLDSCILYDLTMKDSAFSEVMERLVDDKCNSFLARIDLYFFKALRSVNVDLRQIM